LKGPIGVQFGVEHFPIALTLRTVIVRLEPGDDSEVCVNPNEKRSKMRYHAWTPGQGRGADSEWKAPAGQRSSGAAQAT
jgi:hypothetical protein